MLGVVKERPFDPLHIVVHMEKRIADKDIALVG